MKYEHIYKSVQLQLADIHFAFLNLEYKIRQMSHQSIAKKAKQIQEHQLSAVFFFEQWTKDQATVLVAFVTLPKIYQAGLIANLKQYLQTKKFYNIWQNSRIKDCIKILQEERHKLRQQILSTQKKKTQQKSSMINVNSLQKVPYPAILIWCILCLIYNRLEDKPKFMIKMPSTAYQVENNGFALSYQQSKQNQYIILTFTTLQEKYFGLLINQWIMLLALIILIAIQLIQKYKRRQIMKNKEQSTKNQLQIDENTQQALNVNRNYERLQ